MKTLLIAFTLTQAVGPPPAPPVYRCAPQYMFPSLNRAFCQGRWARYQLDMQTWRAELDYWRALHEYQGGAR